VRVLKCAAILPQALADLAWLLPGLGDGDLEETSPNINRHCGRNIRRELIRGVAVVVARRWLAVDDVQLAIPRVKPDAWRAIAVVAAVVASGCEVNNRSPVRLRL
jgi:hypothetical protein